MAVTFVKNHTDANNKTAGTTLALSLDTAVPAGNLIVCRMVYDNAATAGKPVIASIGVAAGETATWVPLLNSLSASTTAGAFASGAMRSIRTTVAWPAGSYTVTLDTSVTQKAGFFQEFSGSLADVRPAGVGGTAYSTTTTAASAATIGTTPAIGDLAIGLIFGSNVAAAMAGDNDTTGGAWSTPFGFGSTGGNVATNNFGVAQYKILTAASQQTLNNSAAMTAGNGAIVVVLQAVPDPAITQAAYGFYADGTETASTALAATNTAPTVDLSAGDVSVQVRVRLQLTTSAPEDFTTDFQLQMSKNAGAYGDVRAAGIADTYGSANAATVTQLRSGSSAASQSFRGMGGVLTRMGFWMSKSGTPDGTVTATLYSHSGTFGSTSIPSAVLQSSTTVIQSSSLTTSAQWIYFDFPGTFTMLNGTNYVAVVSTTNTTTTQFVQSGIKTTSADHEGNSAVLLSSTWQSSGTQDMVFEVWTAASSIIPFDSPNLTDAAATTNRLGAGTGTFVAGKVSEDGVVNDLGWAGNNYTELLYSVKISKTDFVNGDVIQFRVARNGTTSFVSYTQTPTINITKTNPAVTQAAFQFYADGTESVSIALAAQNATPSVNLLPGDANIQLRTRLQSTNAGSLDATDDWQLQWEKNASGTWTNAAPPALDRYAESNADGVGSLPNGFVVGQSFLGDGSSLTRAGFYFSTTGTPFSGTFTAVLYAHTGTFGTGTGTGAVLATSTTSRPVTDFSSTPGWYYFDFAAGTTLTNGTPYVIGLKYAGTNGDASNHVNIHNDASSPTHAGSSSSFNGTTWSTNTYDEIFEVYTSASSASGPVVPYNSANLTDAAATTNRLTGGTGTFVAGEVSETGLATDLGWTGNNYTELLYSLTLKSADLADADTLRFRILRNGATTGLTYTSVPTIAVSKTTGPPPGMGTAAVTYSYTQAGVGAKTPKGTAVATYTDTLAAAGKRTPVTALAAATYSFVTTAAGTAPATGGSASFITGTGFTSVSLRSDWNDFAGYRILVGATPVVVTHLGRWVATTTGTGSHPVVITAAGTGSSSGDWLASVTVNTTGQPVGFAYVALASPITLSAGAEYVVASQEDMGGDQWYDVAPLTGTAVASVVSSAHAGGNRLGGPWTFPLAPGSGYVPANFKYSTGVVSPSTGSAAVTYSFAATATGTKPTKGTAAAAYTDTLAAAGKRTPVTALAAITYTERVTTAVGKAGPGKGTVAPAYNFVVTAAGKAGPGKGTVAVTYTQVSTAAGQRTPKATAAVTWTEALTAAGKKAQQGTAAATYTETLTSAGKAGPGKGIVAASHTWAVAAAGVTPAVGMKQGLAAVAYNFTQTAVGKKAPQATAVVAYTETLTAAGKKIQQGTATTTWTEALAAQGKRVAKTTTVAVTYTETQTAAGARTPKATSAPTHTWTVVAAGKKDQKGTAATTWTEALAAQGKRTPKATVPVGYTEVLTAAGKKITKATVTSAHTWTVLASGFAPLVGVNQGTALVRYSWDTTGTGKRVPSASTALTYHWVVTAQGVATALQSKQGSAALSYRWDTAVAGQRTPKSTVAVTYRWAPLSAGKKDQRGTAAVAHLWVPVAAGKRLQKGVAALSVTWVTTGAGHKITKGFTSAHYLVLVDSQGEAGVLGVIEGNWNGLVFDAMQYNGKNVIEWYMVPV